MQPLNVEAVAKLRALQVSTLKDGGPFRSMNVNTINAAFRTIVNAAGIEPCTVHDLRRSFATDLARLNINQLVCQRLMGHASSATTARYYQHVDDEMERAAVERLGISA